MGEWISVKDSLPKDMRGRLVNKGGVRDIACFNNPVWKQWGSRTVLTDVVHWFSLAIWDMLPDTPNSDGDDNG